MEETENQYEGISNTIDYYKNLQAIKCANTCENKVLEYEIKVTKVKLGIFGIDYHDVSFDGQEEYN